MIYEKLLIYEKLKRKKKTTAEDTMMGCTLTTMLKHTKQHHTCIPSGRATSTGTNQLSQIQKLGGGLNFWICALKIILSRH